MADGYAAPRASPASAWRCAVPASSTPPRRCRPPSPTRSRCCSSAARSPAAGRGLRSGYYHENDQLAACATLTKSRGRADSVEALLPDARPLLGGADARPAGAGSAARSRSTCCGQRRRPTRGRLCLRPPPPLAPAPGDVEALARLVAGWRRPLLLAGGGVVSAGAEPALRQVAERLGAPVFHTAMGKCAIPADHPLAAGMPWRRATADLTGMDDFLFAAVHRGRRPARRRLPLHAAGHRELEPCACRRPSPRSTWTPTRSAGITRSRRAWRPTPAWRWKRCSHCCRRGSRPPWAPPRPEGRTVAAAGRGPGRPDAARACRRTPSCRPT